MQTARSLTRLAAVVVLGLGLVAGCTNGGHPPKTTKTTKPPGPSTTVVAPNGLVDVEGFAAWVNAEPPGPRTLLVTGTVRLASPAYAARLEPANPQGFNPRILLVNLIVTKVTDNPVPAVVVERQVRLVASPDYDRVTILGAGEALDLEVEIAH